MITDVPVHTSRSSDPTEESSKDVKPIQQKDQQNQESCLNRTLDSLPKNTSDHEQQININDVFDPVEHREFENIVKDWNFTGN